MFTVDHDAWQAGVQAMVDRLGDRLLPVVKGNGYGFGRPELGRLCHEFGVPEVAVGTVFELQPELSPMRQLVLTPTSSRTRSLQRSTPCGPVRPTRRSERLANPARGWRSSWFRRCDDTGPLDRVRRPDRFGRRDRVLRVPAPLAGSDEDRVAELEAWLPHLPAVPVSTSHLSVEAFERLADRSGRPLQLRVGTALWHARRDALRLGADVLEVARSPPGALRPTARPASRPTGTS
ncbi:MAG: hypothetical protein R2715_15510 [Ilumatobacteraceae bacterium]